jgi:hypothetical protein
MILSPLKNSLMPLAHLFRRCLPLLLLCAACSKDVSRKDAQNAESDPAPRVAIDPLPPPAPWQPAHTAVVVPPGDDVPAIFRALRNSGAVQHISFSPGRYVITDTLHLPRTGSLVVISGNGASIKVGRGIPLFYSMPSNQSDAMVYNKTRYLIENFGQVEGGSHGVLMGSSFNTLIRNVEWIGQEVAAIDLVFCLMCTIEQVLVTNPLHDGIVLRSGLNSDTREAAWPGASYNNSQCNHTVVRSTRVYNRKECTGTSFKVLQSTGVRLLDCISEGWQNRRAVFFDADRCTTAKYFAIDNFHLEHAPTDGALVFRSFGSTVHVNGLFTQIASTDSPTIWLMNNGNYAFSNIPWWPEGAWVRSSHSPSVVINRCTNKFYDFSRVWVNGERPGQPIFREYFRVADDFVR